MGHVPAWILRKGTVEEQSLPRPASYGPWVWQWPSNTGGLSWACSPWEEMSLNIWLLTRTIYKASGHTGLTGERGSYGPMSSCRQVPVHGRCSSRGGLSEGREGGEVNKVRPATGAGSSLPLSLDDPYPRTQSQPMEFKAWNFSLRFRTLPC